MNKIVRIDVEPDYILRLTYADGEIVCVDFKQEIEPGKVTEPLADPKFFRQVQIARRGRAIAWPGEIDFCADALKMQGEKQK